MRSFLPESLRITPAGAGKTPVSVFLGFSLTDHPRRCGENCRIIFTFNLITGSPPKVRGKLLKALSWVAIQRITPAGAGKTLRVRAPPPSRTDHPRRCGENVITCISGAGISGSPPQVRGKQRRRCGMSIAKRITPAGAGKTSLLISFYTIKADHPRRCGENSINLASISGGKGSPPQVRGKHDGSGTNVYSSGITPAGAGKTSLVGCDTNF